MANGSSSLVFIVIIIALFIAYKQGFLKSFLGGGTTTPPPGTTPPPAGGPIEFAYFAQFGSQGTGDGQFQDPHDVSFDSQGNAYIPDRVRNDIQVFTGDGTFIKSFGGSGSGPVQFNVPYSTEIDPNDDLYVCDRENNRLQKMTKDGEFILEVTNLNGKDLNMPEDLATDHSNGNMYLCDTGNNRVIKLDSQLNFILEWGSPGTGDGQFDHNHAIAVSPTNGNVYVSCGNLPYVQIFDKDGNFLSKFGEEGTERGQIQMFLEHMDIDKAGRVYLINNNVRPVVHVFDANGVFLTEFGSQTEGGGDGELAEPEHVTIDPNGNPWVVDSGNFRIQIFKPTTTTTAAFARSYYTLYQNKMGNVY